MEYINYFSEKIGEKSLDRRLPEKMIKNNKVVNFLKSHGYKFVHFSSGWGPTDKNKHADYDFNESGSLLTEFSMVLYQTTFLYAFEYYIGLLRNIERKRRLGTIEKITNMQDIDSPKFVFAHIMSPHPPYLFGRNGEFIKDPLIKLKGEIWSQKEDYINQFVFLNLKLRI